MLLETMVILMAIKKATAEDITEVKTIVLKTKELLENGHNNMSL